MRACNVVPLGLLRPVALSYRQGRNLFRAGLKRRQDSLCLQARSTSWAALPVLAVVDRRREAAVAHRRVSAVLVTAAFAVALQPIVSLSTGRIVGAEALARFRDGRSPDLGFADARRAGLSMELEVQAFAAALTVFDALPDTAYLSANAIPEVLMDASWVDGLVALGVPLERLASR